MEPRITLITPGVINLPQAVRFYRNGLGWPAIYQAGGPIAFINTTGTRLALYPLKKLAADISPEIKPARAGFGGIPPAAARVAQSSRLRVVAASRCQSTAMQSLGAGRLLHPQARTPAPAASSSRRRTSLGRAQRLFQRPGRLLLGGGLESGRAPRCRRLYEADAMKPLFGRPRKN
jgi:catechol 2,3-dioxygenase-like lactoylglutathione lyase family enzyme